MGFESRKDANPSLPNTRSSQRPLSTIVIINQFIQRRVPFWSPFQILKAKLGFGGLRKFTVGPVLAHPSILVVDCCALPPS